MPILKPDLQIHKSTSSDGWIYIARVEIKLHAGSTAGVQCRRMDPHHFLLREISIHLYALLGSMSLPLFAPSVLSVAVKVQGEALGFDGARDDVLEGVEEYENVDIIPSTMRLVLRFRTIPPSWQRPVRPLADRQALSLVVRIIDFVTGWLRSSQPWWDGGYASVGHSDGVGHRDKHWKDVGGGVFFHGVCAERAALGVARGVFQKVRYASGVRERQRSESETSRARAAGSRDHFTGWPGLMRLQQES
ncbi:hypothetical protein EYC84_007833 [Monilinia fructicola]|uniref:Uncharacterized protein n=1 Tax=Monilinia fructicola TaxID=38448 RepID=A0A5M9JHF1_MONFR|nr:hypothetical protein EYC84_007833 [Monilinia fructicola]